MDEETRQLAEEEAKQLAKECVDRGFDRIMAYFDGDMGWMQRVNFDRLYISLGSSCLLQQVFGNYQHGVHALGLSMGTGDIQEHAFCTTVIDGLDDDVLREAWRAKITAELAAA